MPDSTDADLGPIPPAAVADQWLALWGLGTAMTWATLAALPQIWDTRQLRTLWSKSLTEAVDRYLRSPEFLAVMASNLNAMTRAAGVHSQSPTQDSDEPRR
jgi:hypothetical protein